MTGHYAPQITLIAHRIRRIDRRMKLGQTRRQAVEAEDRLNRRLQKYIDYVHRKQFTDEMAARFNGKVDPR